MRILFIGIDIEKFSENEEKSTLLTNELVNKLFNTNHDKKNKINKFIDIDNVNELINKLFLQKGNLSEDKKEKLVFDFLTNYSLTNDQKLFLKQILIDFFDFRLCRSCWRDRTSRSHWIGC